MIDVSKIEKANQELLSKKNELEEFKKITVDREQKMIELKEEIKKLKEQN